MTFPMSSRLFLSSFFSHLIYLISLSSLHLISDFYILSLTSNSSYNTISLLSDLYSLSLLSSLTPQLSHIPPLPFISTSHVSLTHLFSRTYISYILMPQLSLLPLSLIPLMSLIAHLCLNFLLSLSLLSPTSLSPILPLSSITPLSYLSHFLHLSPITPLSNLHLKILKTRNNRATYMYKTALELRKRQDY